MKLQLFAMMAVLLSSCGLSSGSTDTSCAAGTAEIDVYDGFIKRVCGCAESTNTNFSSGQSLQCTVNAGTRLFVSFINIQTNHQIVISGLTSTSTRGASTNSVQTDVIYLNSTGTFSFQDFFAPTLGGSLIVN